MARITLYVSDELKARLDAAGDEINWSDVARPVLTEAVASLEHRKGDMTTAIERLRASKQRGDQAEKVRGKDEGRKWAEEKAEYRWLQRLHRRRKSYPKENPGLSLEYAIDPNEELSDEEWETSCHPLSRSPT